MVSRNAERGPEGELDHTTGNRWSSEKSRIAVEGNLAGIHSVAHIRESNVASASDRHGETDRAPSVCAPAGVGNGQVVMEEKRLVPIAENGQKVGAYRGIDITDDGTISVVVEGDVDVDAAGCTTVTIGSALSV